MTTETLSGRARRSTPKAAYVPARDASATLSGLVLELLENAKAEDIVSIDLIGKSSIADTMIIASGRSQRHVGAIADQLQKALKEKGYARVKVEGMPTCDWVLLDVGDVVVHVFRPEVRDFYNLEKMWSADRPPEGLAS
ncbi:MAG: ribosome silencing factor [Hyphomicrobiaceae bacterium]